MGRSCYSTSTFNCKQVYEGADAKILSAGYHEGATYFELLDFVTRKLEAGGIPTVDVDDGLLAVTLGAAAHNPLMKSVFVKSIPCCRRN